MIKKNTMPQEIAPEKATYKKNPIMSGYCSCTVSSIFPVSGERTTDGNVTDNGEIK